ncbi:hypothetical protein NIES2100_45620 [Calothrix sp. NIES-2100]|uniref:hypothetical protein n=1 Tax=Calothrix sp. NIES-2100 TaxID=1954172 RepID=UPI000B600583|nr:hypothetical protein NIES2100_45620 [Calothrix sp. NIES-2100]
MTETKPNHIVRRGRLFPEIKWTQEQKIQWQSTLEAHYQRCKIIFDRVQPELLKTHYNWFIAVEADSGDYFIDKDEEIVTHMCIQKHPNAIPFIFVINETGVTGRI